MTPFTRSTDASLTDLASDAAYWSLRDAGIDAKSIGAGFFANVLGPQLTGSVTAGQHVMATIGIRRIPVVNVENACTSGSTAIWLAVNAIRAGATDVAMVIGAEKMSVSGLGLLSSGSEELETLLGMVMPASFALRARRHMIEFGTTAGQMAMVSVKNRNHAINNPLAQYRTSVTVEEVLASPMIADPITRLQCCPIANGAAAVVLASSRFAQGKKRSIRMDASVLCSGSYRNPVDLVRWESDYRGAKLAFEQAGMGPQDLDVIECHDAFSIAEIMHCEALGLCETGAGGAMVERGETALGGRIPVNVSGGLLSRGHPIAATGCAQIVELVQQLRGEAGARQVGKARTGLAQCMGGDQAGDAKSCTVMILSK